MGSENVGDYVKRVALIRAKLFDKETLERIQAASPKGHDAKSYAQNVLNACGRDMKLLNCSVDSILRATMDSAVLGLPVGTALGHGYIVPYKQRAEFQAGYQGYLRLAYNDGRATHAAAEVVYRGDEFDYRLGTRPYVKHVPKLVPSEGRSIVAAYGIISASGPPFVSVASIADLDEHAQQYIQKDRGGNILGSALYSTNPAAWYKKTILRRALKLVPMSEVARRVLNAEDYIEQNLDFDEPFESGDIQTHDSLRGALGLPVAEPSTPAGVGHDANGT